MFRRKYYAFCNGKDPDSFAPIRAGTCKNKSELAAHIKNAPHAIAKAFYKEYDAQIWCKLMLDEADHPNLDDPYYDFMRYSHAFSRTMGEMQAICKNANITEEQFIELMKALKIVPGISEIFQPNQIPKVD